MVCEPVTCGVYGTEQVPALKVQLLPVVKLPVPLVVNATLPAGVVAPLPAVSVTVALQVVVPFATTGSGAQITDVVVLRVGPFWTASRSWAPAAMAVMLLSPGIWTTVLQPPPPAGQPVALPSSPLPLSPRP